jgi:hypothetical protein
MSPVLVAKRESSLVATRFFFQAYHHHGSFILKNGIRHRVRHLCEDQFLLGRLGAILFARHITVEIGADGRHGGKILAPPRKKSEARLHFLPITLASIPMDHQALRLPARFPIFKTAS